MTLIRGVICSLVCAGVLAVSASAAYAQSAHVISVPVDSTTAGDLALISDFLTFAPAGAPVSQSLRRIVMAAVGEMTLATAARIDSATTTLTLDDGTVVPLQQGDTVQAQQGPPSGKGPIFMCENTGNPHRKCQPTCVCNRIFGGPATTCMPVPPVQKDSPPEACPVTP